MGSGIHAIRLESGGGDDAVYGVRTVGGSRECLLRRAGDYGLMGASGHPATDAGRYGATSA